MTVFVIQNGCRRRSCEQKQKVPTKTRKAGIAVDRDSSAKNQAFGNHSESHLIRRGTIGHAELCTEVLREQSDGVSIAIRIALRQVFHGLDQQLLPFDVAPVANSRRTAPLWLGDYRDRQYSGHGYQSFMKADIEARRVGSRNFYYSLPV